MVPSTLLTIKNGEIPFVFARADAWTPAADPLQNISAAVLTAGEIAGALRSVFGE